MNIDLASIPDELLVAEYRRREDIERSFAWATALMRDYAIWESETGRSRKITEWHARQIAEKLCSVFGMTREDFARQVIEHSTQRDSD